MVSWGLFPESTRQKILGMNSPTCFVTSAIATDEIAVWQETESCFLSFLRKLSVEHNVGTILMYLKISIGMVIESNYVMTPERQSQ